MCSYDDMVAIRYLNSNSESRVSSLVAGCYYPGMNLRAVRLANLRLAIALAGDVDALAAAADVSKKYLEQIVSGFQGKKDKNPRAVGNTLADKISIAVGMQPGWMDQPHADLWKSRDIDFVASDLPNARHSEDVRMVANSKFATTATPWPFSSVPYARIAALSNTQRREVEMALITALTIVESRPTGKKPSERRKVA